MSKNIVISRRQGTVCFSIMVVGLLSATIALSITEAAQAKAAQIPDSRNSKAEMVQIQDAPLAKQNWVLNCMGCHKIDGSGIPIEMPSLNGQVAKFLSVEGGRQYLGYVPGIANSPLTDEELADLMNWMLVTFDPENIPTDFEEYSAVEVQELRKLPLKHDIMDVRSALVSKLQKSTKNGSP